MRKPEVNNKKPLETSEAQAEAAAVLKKVASATARARSLAAQQDWAGAAEAMRLVAERTPGDVNAWLQIAAWEQAAGHAEEALATLRRAIELNENRVDVLPALWLALVEHLCQAQQWDEAALSALQGVEAARAAARAGREPGALAEQGGLAREPHRLREHELLELLATARAHQGRFEEAGEAMRALLALSPRDPLHRMRLASLLQSHGALGEAAHEFERVLELAPNTFFARDAEVGLDLLDKAQIQQILTRAAEQRSFGLRLERDLDTTLAMHSFYLSESGRESLRQMIDDGRPDLSGAPRMH